MQWTKNKQTGKQTNKQTQTNKHVQHFNFQLMHTTLKNIELLKYFKMF